MKIYWRLPALETLQPLVYVVWDDVAKGVRNWNGHNPKDILGKVKGTDGNLYVPDTAIPPKPVYPNEVAVIESLDSD